MHGATIRPVTLNYIFVILVTTKKTVLAVFLKKLNYTLIFLRASNFNIFMNVVEWFVPTRLLFEEALDYKYSQNDDVSKRRKGTLR